VLAADRIVGVPHLVEFGCPSEVVDMPMRRGGVGEMMLEASPDTARAKGAADIDVNAWA
jgi:hypothetical protein